MALQGSLLTHQQYLTLAAALCLQQELLRLPLQLGVWVLLQWGMGGLGPCHGVRCGEARLQPAGAQAGACLRLAWHSLQEMLPAKHVADVSSHPRQDTSGLPEELVQLKMIECVKTDARQCYSVTVTEEGLPSLIEARPVGAETMLVPSGSAGP